jgi:predicted P-loop ATPase
LRLGFYEDAIVSKLAHKKVSEAKLRAWIKSAIVKIKLAIDENGKPYSSAANLRIAMLKLGVCIRYNQFSDRRVITGLDDFGPFLDDDAVNRLWLFMNERFSLQFGMEFFYRVITDAARRNAFHPVRDRLNQLQSKWDGVKRLDKWLSTYAGAESSPYTDAVGALVLIAAVRRIRQPGCKFDEMLILESPQGKLKSMGLQALALEPDWFTDDFPLHLEGKQLIEAIQGRWIIEAGELQGMSKADIEHLKATLARQVDRARMSYGRLAIDWARQCIIIGTTNSRSYLKDLTGNRRYWPAAIEQFDVEKLKDDRDQLWAEAAVREAKGESIRLNPSLWGAAGEEQSKRTVDDPFYETLAKKLDGVDRGKITKDLIWEALGYPDVKDRTTFLSQRMTEAMARLGWSVPKNRTINHNNQKVAGFTKGPTPWPDTTANDLNM